MQDSINQSQESNTTTQATVPLRVFTLIRLPKRDDCTFGVWLDENNLPLFTTIEKPWRNNQKFISHIPVGEYTGTRRHSNHFNCDVFGLINVTNHDDIEIHIANLVKDVEGCIGIGDGFACGIPEIISSKDSFNAFMNMMKGIDSFKLVIKEV